MYVAVPLDDGSANNMSDILHIQFIFPVFIHVRTSPIEMKFQLSAIQQKANKHKFITSLYHTANIHLNHDHENINC